MTFWVTTDMVCDKCGDWTPGEVSKSVQVTAARAIARKRGWTCPAKRSEFQKDLCPLCNGKAKFKLADGGYAFNVES